MITLPGTTSVRLHEALGFTPAGVWRRAGFKLGQWWDVGVWQKELQRPADPPVPVIPFAILQHAPALREALAD